MRWDAIGDLPSVAVQDIEIDPPSFVVRRSGRALAAFSVREFQVLLVLMQNAGRVLPPGRIERAVWGSEHADHGTIQTYIKKLRQRIEDDPHRPTRIRTVRGVGYIFDVAPVVTDED